MRKAADVEDFCFAGFDLVSGAAGRQRIASGSGYATSHKLSDTSRGVLEETSEGTVAGLCYCMANMEVL